MSRFLNWEITRLIQFHDYLFIVGEVRRKQFLHVPVTDRFAIPQNLIYINSHYQKVEFDRPGERSPE